MTSRPSHNSSISIIGLAVIGITAVAGIIYNIDRWLAGGATIKRVTESCNVMGDACSDAVSSIWTVIGSPSQLLLTLAVAAFALAVIKAGLILGSAYRAAARFVIPAELDPRIAGILGELGCESVKVKIAQDDAVVAFTYGLIRPVVCLSTGVVERLSDDELAALIAHELGHVKRRDNLLIFLALFVKDFLWPLPISHHLFSIFVSEKEYAADDYAVHATGKPVDLAGAIVSVAKAAQGGRPFSPAYATFFSDKATAKVRVNRLLGMGERAKPSVARLLVSMVVSVAMMASIVGVAYAQSTRAEISGCSMGGVCEKNDYACCAQK